MGRKWHSENYDVHVQQLRSRADGYEARAAEDDRNGKHDSADKYLGLAASTRNALNALHERGPGND